MKKTILAIGLIGVTSSAFAQSGLVTQYPEELYQYGSSAADLGGTARFQGLSGAMGALGGDLSATTVNPAGSAVFLQSEGVLTGGVNLAKTKSDHSGNDYDDSEFNFDQIGAVLVFDELNSAKWRNIAVGINYQRQANVNEVTDINTNTTGLNGNTLRRIYSEKYGESTVTNVNFAANYNDRLYIGAGVNFHTFESNTFDAVQVYEPGDDAIYNYYKGFSPNSRLGSGVSASVGIIGKVNQQVRLGLAYQSPTWYRDVEEIGTEYYLTSGTDAEGDYYNISRETNGYFNDLNTAHKFTGSAAVVIGKNGLISADYTLTDYSSAKYKPDMDFAAENAFIDNSLKSTSTLRVGGEVRLNDFKVRGGFRYEQSPFEEVAIMGGTETYQPFGDLTGFSLGAGYTFNGFFVDAAYNFFKRDRNYLVSGNYYDANSWIDGATYTEEQAADLLSFNAEANQFSGIIKDITEQQGNISLSVGFRF